MIDFLNRITGLWVLCVLVATGCQAEQSVQIENTSTEKIKDYWFNGAEISRYTLTQARYGKTHTGSAELVFVTEPFLTDKQVKHEYGSGPSEAVLKMNALRTFNTGLYSYRTMVSVFQPLALPEVGHAFKITTSVQDWCGQVFHQMNRRDNQWKGELRSYFQGEGDRDFELPLAWQEDELWARLRVNPQSLPQGKIQVIPGSLYLRFRHLPYAVHEAEGQLLAGEEEHQYTLRYPKLGRKLTFMFEPEFPYVLKGWRESQEGSDAVTEARLTDRIEHSAYWSLNQPRDRKQRKQLGLPADFQ